MTEKVLPVNTLLRLINPEYDSEDPEASFIEIRTGHNLNRPCPTESFFWVLFLDRKPSHPNCGLK